MPTTFNVLVLGTGLEIDTLEGNTEAEGAALLTGSTFGGAGDPLFESIAELSPGSTGFAGGTATAYDMDNAPAETFRIDGGADRTFDAVAVYNATITYTDGTTATITAVVFQDTDGTLYLAPETTANADQAALEAKPIESLTLGTLVSSSFSGLSADRQVSNFATCFTPGALIATPGGPRPVEDLRPGDLVRTLDGGPRPVRWTGGARMRAEGAWRPVRIAAGSLGAGLPETDLVVSRQHRMLLRSRVAERMFGAPEVLVSAHHLAGLPGIEEERGGGEVRYLHLLLDRHEILVANGAPTESLLTRRVALAALGPAARAAIDALDPGLIERASVPSRPLAEGGRARRLVERIARNGRAPVEPVRAQRGATAA